jgi:hypothetical protein
MRFFLSGDRLNFGPLVTYGVGGQAPFFGTVVRPLRTAPVFRVAEPGGDGVELVMAAHVILARDDAPPPTAGLPSKDFATRCTIPNVEALGLAISCRTQIAAVLPTSFMLLFARLLC